MARDLVLARGRMDLQSRQQNSRRFPFWGTTCGHDLKDSYSVPKSICDSNSVRETNKNNGNSNDDGESTGSNLDSLLSLSKGMTYDTACQTSASPPHDFDGRLESETCGGTGPNQNRQGSFSPSATTDTRQIKSEVAFDLFAFAAYECDSNAREQNPSVTGTSVSSFSSNIREYNVDSSDDAFAVYKESPSTSNPIVDELTEKMSQLWFHRTQTQVHQYAHCKPGGNLVIDQPHLDQVAEKHQFDKDRTEPAALDKVKAREMLEMRVGEREAINNEIHGVQSRSVPESPSMIATALLSLQEEIDEHIDEELLDKDNSNPGGFSKKAYKRGLELNSVYIQSDSFRIRFLRKSLYDVRDAALQFFRYLDWIHELFGDSALMRPLFLSDLTKRELKYFKRGQQQLFPSQDRAGRRIYAFLGCNNTTYTTKEKYRVQAYLFDVLAQDEKCQKLGFVYIGIVQRSGKIRIGGKKDAPRMLLRSNNACPCRWAAYHLCFPDTLIYSFVQAVTFLIFDKNWRPLVRFHSGSQLENNYHLCGYGIPSSEIPMTISGKVKTKNLAKFLHARGIIEKYQKKEIQKEHVLRYKTARPVQCFRIPIYSGVECPNKNSVVFGDEKMYDQPGNVRFRTFLRNMEKQRMVRIASYDETVTSSLNFVHEIVDEALSPQQNFQFFWYSHDDFLYEEVKDRNDLHRRVHLVLRHLRKRFRPNQNSNEWPGHVISRNHGPDQEEASTIGLSSYKRTKTSNDNSHGAFCS